MKDRTGESGKLFAALDRAFHLATRFPGLDGFAAIVLLFAFGQSQLHLRVTAFGKVNAERNQRETLELGFPDQFVDFLAMQQQLPFAKRIMIHQVAVRIGTDVAMVEVRR